jgi:hypothetical protein
VLSSEEVEYIGSVFAQKPEDEVNGTNGVDGDVNADLSSDSADTSGSGAEESASE